MTVKFAREVIKSVTLNETTIDIYVQPFDMDSYAQSQQVTRRRELKKGGGKASISGVEVPITSSEKEDLLGSLNLERFNLTWELVSFSGTEMIIQVYFKSPIHIS